jgi:hypothetical protein
MAANTNTEKNSWVRRPLCVLYKLNVLNSSATCQILQISATIPLRRLLLVLRQTADAGPEPGLQNGAAVRA